MGKKIKIKLMRDKKQKKEEVAAASEDQEPTSSVLPELDQADDEEAQAIVEDDDKEEQNEEPEDDLFADAVPGSPNYSPDSPTYAPVSPSYRPNSSSNNAQALTSWADAGDRQEEQEQKLRDKVTVSRKREHNDSNPRPRKRGRRGGRKVQEKRRRREQYRQQQQQQPPRQRDGQWTPRGQARQMEDSARTRGISRDSVDVFRVQGPSHVSGWFLQHVQERPRRSGRFCSICFEVSHVREQHESFKTRPCPSGAACAFRSSCHHVHDGESMRSSEMPSCRNIVLERGHGKRVYQLFYGCGSADHDFGSCPRNICMHCFIAGHLDGDCQGEIAPVAFNVTMSGQREPRDGGWGAGYEGYS